MRLIRMLGNVALWACALLGVVAGGVWVAGQMGLVKPLIVISGSMEPTISTGDLLISRWAPTADVEVGDVVSLQSELTGKLVTHRVVDATATDNGWAIRMKGDDNADEDFETYQVGDEVLTPWIKIPQGGKVVSKVMEPSVALPILLALVALLGLSLLDEEPRKVVRRAVARVRQRDPRVDELDAELAAVGVDIDRLQKMDDLDLQLYALGIEIDDEPNDPAGSGDRVDDTVPLRRNDLGIEDGLWDFAMPASDGIERVRMPDETSRDRHRSPAGSG